jgi:mannose-6-phosphate isomerase-like protein (cupin superfamily)
MSASELKYIAWKDVEREHLNPEGALKFNIGGKEIVVHAGEVLCIPSNMPHEAWALEDTIDLDVFDPPREDWLNKTDAYLRHGK